MTDKILLLSSCVVALTMSAMAELPSPERETVVFKQGDGHGYRIPAVVRTQGGRILAFCERRVGLHDHAKNDIVMKASDDDGKTWEALQVLADDGGDSLNDPRAVVLENGRVLVLYKRYPEGYHARKSGHTAMAELGYDGPRNTRSYIIHSDDEGKTWSVRREITKSIRREDAISVGSPGVGIQLTRGVNKGRIVFACYETIPDGKGGRTWCTCAVFSDDGGETWSLGKRIDEAGLGGFGNEAQVVELADGGMLFSARNQGGTLRKLAVSKNGGATWSPYRLAEDLVTPACMASVLRYSWPEGDTPGVLLHSLPSGKSRKNGVLFASRDEGATWNPVAVIQPEGFAYSCLVERANRGIGCLYETAGYKEIRFAVLPPVAAGP